MKASSCLIFLLTVFIRLEAASQTVGTLTGSIFEFETRLTISGATIRVENTGFGAITDKEGKFFIKSLPAGDYTIAASMIGYKTEKSSFTINPGDTLKVALYLDTQPFQTIEVVITATKHLQSVQEVPVSVSVIDSRDIRERNITKLDEILAYIPGVSLNGDHVSIRGSSGFAFGIGSRVSMLIDGFPMLSADGGEIKFDALPIFEAERLEVVKGSGSALYGTGALGGVINFITRKPAEDAEIRINTFSGIYTKPRFGQWLYSDKLYAKYGISGSYSQKLDKFGLIVSGNYISDESYRLYDDTYKFTGFTKLNYDFSDFTKVSVLTDFTSDDRTDWVFWNSLDSATRPPTNTNYDIRILSNKFTVFSELSNVLSDNHFLFLRTGVYNTYFKNTWHQDSSQHRSSQATAYNTELQMNYSPFKSMFLTYGGNYIYNDVVSPTYNNHSQHIMSLYAQGEFSEIEDVIINAGFRLDFEKTAGSERNSEFSPKFGILYNSPLDIQFRASVGRGFRAATVAERYAAIAFQGINVEPNPALKSERSWSYEIGSVFEFKLFDNPIKFDASVFHYDLYDLIEPGFTSEASPSITFKNVTRARIRGYELDVKSLLFNFIGLEASLTALDPWDLTLNRMLNYRNRWLWYSRVSLPFNVFTTNRNVQRGNTQFEFQADYRYLNRIDNIDDNLAILEKLGIIKDHEARVPVHVVDIRLIARLEHFISYKIDISINAKNLLDYYYTEMVANLAPTRFISLQAEISM